MTSEDKMKLGELRNVDWIPCLATPALVAVIGVVILDPKDPILWLVAVHVAGAASVCCLVAYVLVEGRVPAWSLILGAPFVVALVGGVLGGCLGRAVGLPWSVAGFALAFVGFFAGCGVALAQLLRVELEPPRPELSVEANEPIITWPHGGTWKVGAEGKELPRDAYQTGESRQGLQMPGHERPADTLPESDYP
jgi:hypothetical protein